MKIKYNYTPFFKFKANEVASLSMLDDRLKVDLKPFFDIPKKDGMTRCEFEEKVVACRRKADKYLTEFPYIFIDSFDIPDSIGSAGSPNCKVIIDAFSKFEYVPVLGLDRVSDHNSTIYDSKIAGEIVSDTVAVRIQADEFESFPLIKIQLDDLITKGCSVFLNWIFIFDCRVCLNNDVKKNAIDIADFTYQISKNKHINIEKYIITGSSIPSIIGEIAHPNQESLRQRVELEIYHATQAINEDIPLSLGDYTIVSPNYSELSVPGALILSFTAPKVFYAFENYHFIFRGTRLKTNGYGQYDQIFEEIVKKKFMRSMHNSWGDAFIWQRAGGNRPNKVTPGTVLKPTICSHVSYMARNYTK